MIEADCSECGYQVETGNVSEAIEAFNKHNEHTDHDLEIIEFDANLDVELEPGYEVVCSQCEDSWRFSRGKDAKQHAREHENYTDHEPDGIEAAEILSKEAIERVVRKLSTDVSRRAGVPESILVESCVSIGYRRENVKNAIEDAKDDAKIYPIRRGFYQAV